MTNALDRFFLFFALGFWGLSLDYNCSTPTPKFVEFRVGHGISTHSNYSDKDSHRGALMIIVSHKHQFQQLASSHFLKRPKASNLSFDLGYVKLGFWGTFLEVDSHASKRSTGSVYELIFY